MEREVPGLRDWSPFWPERLAALWRNRIAVVDPDGKGEYTYCDLHRRARAMAWILEQRSVRQGDRVAAVMRNGLPMLDLLFACGCLGAMFAPLNWRLSRREIGELISDLDPRLVVADPEFMDVAADTAGTAQVMSRQDDPLAGAGGFVEPSGGIRLTDPWLILYTGGTTGLPKGAVHTHGSITWNSVNTAVSWGLSQADVAPSFTPMFHTGGFNVFTLPLLLLGARVILPRRFEPAQALAILRSERPTLLFMVPTMFQLVAEHPEFDTADLSSLRWAISGGAPLPEPVYNLWKAKVPVFKQGYGLTEVGPNNFATADEDALRKPGTVGRLTCFAWARIVDDAGADVPHGAAGELLLAGPQMCAGYWRRPEETAEAIRDGWFYTGDLARRDQDGYYYIVDRKKDMIITGGENVYPIEVETVLYQHPAVREAAVVGIPDPAWGEAVCAVVSLRHGTSVESEELRGYVAGNLARYKVPKWILIVEEVPKSAAGKILRSEAKKLASSGVHLPRQ